MLKKFLKNRLGSKGFTLVEVIVVLTLLSVIGAVTVMSYPKIILRSKLKSDLQSVRVMQSALDLYVMEGNTVAAGETDISSLLYNAGYLKNNSKPQIDARADWYFNNPAKTIKLNLTAINNESTDVWNVVNGTAVSDRELIHGFTFISQSGEGTF